LLQGLDACLTKARKRAVTLSFGRPDEVPPELYRDPPPGAGSVEQVGCVGGSFREACYLTSFFVSLWIH
jgi:hypothetical protein